MRLLVFFIVFVFCSNAYGADTKNDAQKMAMIAKLTHYLRTEIKLNIPEDIYTKWDKEDKENYLLYVSAKNSIQEVAARPFIFFGQDHKGAVQSQKHYDSLGYSTLLYNTGAYISTDLSNSLLAFPTESLVFIIIHESMHTHLKGKNIPYIIEEASCDLMANYASLKFFEKYYIKEISKVKKQTKLNEKLIRNINDGQKLAEVALLQHKDVIYNVTDKKIKKFDQARKLLTQRAFQLFCQQCIFCSISKLYQELFCSKK
ncbi:MAG: hypothetical protein IPK03_11565 [Bacteroidetes bacterium]|nr:hypothetical protein [Bacteroidota bacterium]